MNGPIRGRLVDISLGLNRKQRVTVELDRDFREDYERLKGQELDVEIKKHREKRSKNASAYFHILVNKIAAETGESDDAVKVRLVVAFGAIDTDEDGMKVGFKLPAGVDVGKIYPYVRCFDTREENGKLFNCYLVYKHTSNMDTKEMARLIDGAIAEAKELGIETDTPEQIERYKEAWSR
jgi:hypothetical protein